MEPHTYSIDPQETINIIVPSAYSGVTIVANGELIISHKKGDIVYTTETLNTYPTAIINVTEEISITNNGTEVVEICLKFVM